MTESEAKTKWCPFARTMFSVEATGRLVSGPTAIASANRFPGESPGSAERGSLCVASNCMAWRATDNETVPTPPGEPDQPSKPAGYCGLAGAPQ
jgi:hypothetical protein